MEIEKDRFELRAQCTIDIKKSDAARSAQILPARRREHVTSDLPDVQRHVSRSLASVEQEPHACFPRRRADRFDGLHGSTVGRNERERNELDARIVQAAPQRLYGNLPVFIIRNDLDAYAAA